MSASGPTLYAFHNCFPETSSTAAIHPRTPISPPLEPTITLLCTTIGAIVIVSPRVRSPIFVRQSSFPVAASIATVCPSSRL
jgi:hypothetical protein